MKISGFEGVIRKEHKLILTEHEIQQAVKQAETAFSNFADWEYNNETNEHYSGFSLWGEYTYDPKEGMPGRFYITFDIYGEEWRGYLSIGKHSYFWSCANFGDAILLTTERCKTLEDAIVALKAEIAKLFRAFSVI